MVVKIDDNFREILVKLQIKNGVIQLQTYNLMVLINTTAIHISVPGILTIRP